MTGKTRVGLFSLVDHLSDPLSGVLVSAQQRLLEVIEQGVLAEQAGFERFAVGEHHFSHYILPNPSLILAAIAARTRSIRLFTSVTLLACRDPVQLAEDVAILDNISDGRLELSIARGVSFEAARVFGVDRENVYPMLAERLAQLLTILSTGRLPGDTDGTSNLRMFPLPLQKPHPVIWVGGGLSSQSCALAIDQRLPLILPSLFRYPEDYLPMLGLYREGLGRAGREDCIRVGLPSHCWVAKTSQLAKERWRPRLEHYVLNAKGVREGLGRATDFDALLQGPAICGSPAEVVDRLSKINELLGLSNHILLMDAGGMPHAELKESLELMGDQVLPHFNERFT
jgi:alkanesulfonate monooxygenase SsuD/methylene tetrahydromethanopterin reductase-like flavin-dependent oxidoreductase (luciferase family)